MTAGASDPTAEAAKHKRLVVTLGTGVVALLALVVVLWIIGLGSDEGSETIFPNFPKDGPAEFLYLDKGRVAAYLAQIDGGSFSSEKQSQKLVKALNGKVNVENTVELGGSKSTEEFVEREVSPTAASNFFALETGLKKQHVIRKIHLPLFEEEVEGLPEGQFVYFKTRAMLSPIYTNPYLAGRRRHALTAIFPGGDDPGLEQKAEAERKTARAFMTELGKSPRIVFSLHARKPDQELAFTYLLPMAARPLTEEQSLIKYGGGKFTVVGKVVRIFPEEGDDHEPAYVDSETLHTWERPLGRGPGELLCRTDPRCAKKVREEDLDGPQRHAAIERSRTREIKALRQQTTIEGRGAVILPLAIYK
ncbi:MAG TPA: hypothetical protein VNN15_06860 [Solirubrobacterales bacterium]|nr:hypothetical protein [Solirubrobacterales bacterium]